MKTKHKFLSVLLVVVMCLTLCFTLIACTDKGEDTEPATDTSKYIANGNFEVTTSEDFPKVPSSWTSGAGSTASGDSTPTDKKSLTAGVIDTNDDVYKKNKKKWDNLENPRSAGTTDSNILMIYNRVANSYKYTSSNFSLDANKYYKVEIAVKTSLADETAYGAYVQIGGDAMVEFENINTKNEWSTLTTYIKTSPIAKNSFNVVLSNGKGGKNGGKLAEGYAFFDNIVISEAKAEDYDNLTEDSTNKKVDLTYGDADFVNISGSENTFTARKWSGVSSQGADGTNAPTGSDYLERGIVDFNAGSLPNSIDPKYNPTHYNKDQDPRVLMINNKQKTAYGYKSDARIRFISKGVYKLSFMVMTALEEDSTGGAYIKLKATTDKNEQIGVLENINTNGEWKEISVYVKGADKRNKDIYVEVGLGKGGKNDNQLVKGIALFDHMTVETIEESDIPAEETIIDLNSKIAADDEFGTTWTEDMFNVDGEYTDEEGIGTYKGEKADFMDGDDSDSYKPFDGAKTAVKLENSTPTIQKRLLQHDFSISGNTYYRMSILVKTDILKKNQGLTVKLYRKKGADAKPGEKDTVVSSFDNINTTELTKDMTATNLNNGFVELVFLIEGDYAKDAELYLQFELGSGNNLTPTTLVTGKAYISNIEIYKLSYSDYSSESGDQIKKVNLKASQGTNISNATFDNADISSTIKQYGDDLNKGGFDESDYYQGNSKGQFALPSSWTFTSADWLTADSTGLRTGILDTQSDNQFGDKLYQLSASSDVGNYSTATGETIEPGNVLLISNTASWTPGEEAKALWGYTSPSISLSKNGYYTISVWAKAMPDTTASIRLKSSNKSVMGEFIITGDMADGNWHEYKFIIETGFDNFTAYLELAIGNANTDTAIDPGAVLFDMPNKFDISEDSFKAEKENEGSDRYINAIEFKTNTFDNVKASENDEQFDQPDGWTGSVIDADAPSGKGHSIGGVYNRYDSNHNLFGGEYENEDGDITTNAPISTEELGKIIDGRNEANGTENTNVLVINNNIKTAYEYMTALSSSSFASDAYYRVSLWVLTYGLDKDATATIKLKLHNDTYTFSSNEYRGIKVNTDGEWREYEFYIYVGKNAEIDSAELSVALGQSKEENYVSGYLFVDDVTVEKIDQEKYDSAVPADKYPGEDQTDEQFKDSFDKSFSATKHRVEFTKEDMNTPAEGEIETETDPLLWLYIVLGITGALAVIAAIVVFMRKYKVMDKLFPKKNVYGEAGSETYNRNNVANKNKSTTNSKDINDKHRD